jgi:peptide/nickel transport system substrate-binding protein
MPCTKLLLKVVISLLLLTLTPVTAHHSMAWSWLGNKNINNTKMNNKVLRFALHVSNMGKMDPHFAAASQDRSLADMVFSGLLRYKPGNAPHIEPDLATGMPTLTMEKGQQVWYVSLRKGTMFHPGPMTAPYELTADDVVYSFTKAADEKRSAYAGDYEGITIHKVDDYTVKFILSKPLSSVLFFPKITNYNGGFIVSKKAMEAMGDEAYEKHPVGTGPFMFQEHIPGEKLILGANNNYFRGKPALEGVELSFIPDTEERKSGLLNGSLDVIIGSGKKGFASELLLHDGIEIDAHGVGEVTTIYFNTSIPPMDDIKVRKAIAYALHKESYLNIYNNNFAGYVYSPVPAQFLPGGLTQKDVKTLGLDYEEDVKKAKALLSQAGYPNGFTLELVGSEKRTYRNFYRILHEQLARIGIVCKTKILPHADMHREIRTNPRPIVIYTAWRPNADVFLSRFFHSDSILISGIKPDTNFSHYTKIDKLIEAARHEVNPEKQINLWHQAQIRILSDMVAYPVIYANMRTPRRDYVDYGHPLISSMALYPQFTEKTKLMPHAVASEKNKNTFITMD